MTHFIYKNHVIHSRLLPKRYKFGFNFYWYLLNLKEIDQLAARSFLFSKNNFNLFSYHDFDHLYRDHSSTYSKVQRFMQENGFKGEISKAYLLTNLRFLGYVFNPVSYYFIEDTHKQKHCIIEIHNTYKEIKPIYVSPQHFKDGVFEITTAKEFYISPFSPLDNTMTFKVKWPREDISVHISDFRQDAQLELQTSLKGHRQIFSFKNLIITIVKKPFATLQIIMAIHYHALKLYLKRVPYFKKDDNKHLQRGYFLWK